MLEIKTIAERVENLEDFDKQVNEALAEGWELVRREVLPPYEGAIHWWPRALYAELERIVEEPEEEEDSTADTVAVWLLSRDPHYPYKCSACGCKIQDPIVNCPHCHRLMEVEE